MTLKIFVLLTNKIGEIEEFLETEYYAPKISLEEAFYMKHAFELLEIKSK
ncbi:MAG: hypothetical protein ACJA1C_000232 [Crocinitomicaceae bacterium]|jgi:hypothetical protein